MLVAVDARHARSRDDWAGDFVRATRCVTFTAAGRKCAVTAGGTVLGNVHDLDSLRAAWDKWTKLPQEQRRPGALALPPDDARPLDLAHEPPAGALVVRTFTRQLERRADGTLRYTEPEDYPVAEVAEMRSGSPRRQAARFREAGHDFMWVPEAEWRALVPRDPQPGARGAVPESFKLRVLRHHLDPERGLGEAQWFTRASAADGELEWVVEEATTDTVRLRLEGRADLRSAGGDRPPTTYDPALLGSLTYDPRADTITRFEMVALGEVANTPRGVRDGRRPLGIAFELVRDPTPAERVVPRGARDDVARYLGAGAGR